MRERVPRHSKKTPKKITNSEAPSVNPVLWISKKGFCNHGWSSLIQLRGWFKSQYSVFRSESEVLRFGAYYC